MKKKKVYLASPLFTELEKENVRKTASLLRSQGIDVYVPMEHIIPNSRYMPNNQWAGLVFSEDVKAINDCDLVICLYYGLMSDSGTAWECGYAYAKGIPVELVTVGEPAECSLMVVQGALNRDGIAKTTYQT